MPKNHRPFQHSPSFILLVEGLRAYGIRKTTAYKLVKQGWLHPFHISGRTYVWVWEIEAMAESLSKVKRHDAA